MTDYLSLSTPYKTHLFILERQCISNQSLCGIAYVLQKHSWCCISELLSSLHCFSFKQSPFPFPNNHIKWYFKKVVKVLSVSRKIFGVVCSMKLLLVWFIYSTRHLKFRYDKFSFKCKLLAKDEMLYQVKLLQYLVLVLKEQSKINSTPNSR